MAPASPAAPEGAGLAAACARLREGMLALELDDPVQQDQVAAYLQLLVRWNRAYNLTGTREPQALVVRHLLDCLAIAPHVDRSPVLDLGAGAGLPGLLLAIVRPGSRFTLLDSNAKKVRFMNQVRIELGLRNVEVLRARAEALQRPGAFALATARAVSEPETAYALLAPLLAPGGEALLMQGPRDEAVIARLRAAGRAVRVLPVAVPGLAEPRHLLAIGR